MQSPRKPAADAACRAQRLHAHAYRMADIARSTGQWRLAVYWQRFAARHHEEARRHLEQVMAPSFELAVARFRRLDADLMRIYWAHLPEGLDRVTRDPEAARRHVAALIRAAFGEMEP